MGVLRTIFHILTLGIVDSNKEVERKNTLCHFSPTLTQSDFENIAVNVAKPIKRLKVFVENEFVVGEVRTSSGINTWKFKLDFNDYGHVSGKYWFSYNDNVHSEIPDSYAQQLKSAIEEHLRTHR